MLIDRSFFEVFSSLLANTSFSLLSVFSFSAIIDSWSVYRCFWIYHQYDFYFFSHFLLFVL